MKRTASSEPDHLVVDANGLAEMLHVSRSHLFKLDATGRIPRGIYLGRRRLWTVVEVVEWINAGAPAREVWEAKR